MLYKEKYIKYKKKYIRLKQNGGRCDYYVVIIGSFNQKSKKIIISDPSHIYIPEEHKKNSKLMKLNLVTKNVKQGKWQVILKIKKEDKEKNAEIICIHKDSFSNESIEEVLSNDKWKKIGIIGVDICQAGIYDLKYYKYNEKIWQEINYELIPEPTDYALSLKYGAVSISENGIYPVYIMKDDSEVVAVKIVFIE